jgi:hypothetical protein
MRGSTDMGWLDDDSLLGEEVSGLPEPMQRRMWALSMAVKTSSDLKPRMHAQDAADEVLALAEQFLDLSYGGRQARLQAMPYKEYLATAEWHEKRRAAYKRADYRCQLCGASETELHAHHRSYENRAKEGEERDLIVLCASCHKRVHTFIWKV